MSICMIDDEYGVDVRMAPARFVVFVNHKFRFVPSRTSGVDNQKSFFYDSTSFRMKLVLRGAIGAERANCHIGHTDGQKICRGYTAK